MLSFVSSMPADIHRQLNKEHHYRSSHSDNASGQSVELCNPILKRCSRYLPDKSPIFRNSPITPVTFPFVQTVQFVTDKTLQHFPGTNRAFWGFLSSAFFPEGMTRYKCFLLQRLNEFTGEGYNNEEGNGRANLIASTDKSD